VRNDAPVLSHITTIPLGYHHKASSLQKTWEERDLVWSFHGTDWFNRSSQLQPFASFVPNSCSLQPDWNHPSATKEKQYLSLLGNSRFCPILRGNNDETFRLYEALEAGTLPITTITNVQYLAWIDQHLDLSSLYEWTNPLAVLGSNVDRESIRQEVVKRWSNWKLTICNTCTTLV